MTEQVWYYARGDVEKGPLTGPQIKALAAAGKIRQDDFVWKEGMESWVAAGDLKELYPGDRPSGKAKEGEDPESAKKKVTTKSKRVVPSTRPQEKEQPVWPLGHTSLVMGLLMVLLARGCDTLAARHVEQLQASANASRDRFQQDWQSRLDELEQDQLTLQAKTNPSATEQRQLSELNSRLAELHATMEGERRQLQRGAWRAQRSAARAAETDHLLWGFWREAVFVLGTAILAVGLLAVAFSGEGPERWICLAMLGAIVFSIYVGGTAFTR